MTVRLAAVTLLFPILLTGCCYIPDIVSVRDPAFSHAPYSTLAVVADFRDLGLRTELEDDIGGAMMKNGVVASRGLDVVPPTRSWTDSARIDAFRKSGAEAFLRIYAVGTTVQEEYVPSKTETRVETKDTKETSNGETGREKDARKSVVTTETTGGYTKKTVVTDVEIELVGLETGTRWWIASTHLPDPQNGHCMKEFSEEIVSKLQEDGVLPELRR